MYGYCDPVQAVRRVLRSQRKQASERPVSNWGLGEGKGQSWSVSPKAWGCRASSLDGSTHSPGLLLKAWTLNSEPDTFRSPEADSWNLAVCRGGRQGDGEPGTLQPGFAPSLLLAVGEAYLQVPGEALRR